jgi:hypothetical protein
MPEYLGGDIRGLRKQAFNAGNALDSILDESLSVLISGGSKLARGGGHARIQQVAKTVVGDWYGLKPMERWLRTQADYAGRKLGRQTLEWLKKEGVGLDELSRALARQEGPRSVKAFKENLRSTRLAQAAQDLKVLSDNDGRNAWVAYKRFLDDGSIDSTEMARSAVKATQFRVGVQDVPIALSGQSHLIKLVSQFKTFTLKHTEMLAHVADQATRGNPLPLMKLLAVSYIGSQITGNIEEEIKSVISGKKLPGGSILSGAIEYVTGNLDQEQWIKRLQNAGMAPHKDVRSALERSYHNFFVWGGFGLPYDVSTSLLSDRAMLSLGTGPAIGQGLEIAKYTGFMMHALAQGDAAEKKRRLADLGGELASLTPVVGAELEAKIAHEEPERKQPGLLEHAGFFPRLTEARQERELRGEIGEQQREIGIQRKPGDYISPADRERGRRERKERAFERDVNKRKILEAYDERGRIGALIEYRRQQRRERAKPEFSRIKRQQMIPPELQELLEKYEIRQ